MRMFHREDVGTSTPQRLWSTTLAGHGNQMVFAGRADNVVYVGDGDGVMYTNLRFRAYSLTDGREAASVRTGTTVRCMTLFPEGDLLVATDHRLHRLDASGLVERQRWQRGIPDFGDAIVLDGDACAVANWQGPWVTVVNLADGKVRRRRWAELPRLLDGPTGPLLIASGDGEVSSLDLGRAERTVVFRTVATRDAIAHAGLLWLIEGRARHGPRDDGESKTLVAYPLGGGTEPNRLRLSSGANRLSAHGASLWAMGGDSIVEVAVDDPVGAVGRWPAPTGHRWLAVDPVRRLGFSATSDLAAATTLVCHSLTPM